MILFLLIGICALEAMFLVAGYAVYREQTEHIQYTRHELELARDENKALMQAIARGAKTPIPFDQQKRQLQPGESYFERQPELTKITAG